MNVCSPGYQKSTRGTIEGNRRKFRREKNAFQPLTRYLQVGGVCTHMAYRYTTPKVNRMVAVAYPISAASKFRSALLPPYTKSISRNAATAPATLALTLARASLRDPLPSGSIARREGVEPPTF